MCYADGTLSTENHSCSATKAILQFKLLDVKLIINLSGEDELE